MERPYIKLYNYTDRLEPIAIIDDYAELSWETKFFESGTFSIQINYNIPDASLFAVNQIIQIDEDKEKIGVITQITDTVAEGGKGSQTRTITGYDLRYVFKRRIIINLNTATEWTYTGSGERCMRELIDSQCGNGVEEKRKLPIINEIAGDGIGLEYTVKEAYTNLYDVLVTIATQTNIGWKIILEEGSFKLEFYSGTLRATEVSFDTELDSLKNGTFDESLNSYANTIYVGGKGQGNNRDIYEGEGYYESGVLAIDDGLLELNGKDTLDIGGTLPTGLQRFEAWDNQSGLTEESEYNTEALAMLNQYNQKIQIDGNGLVKSPYKYGEDYFVGDTVGIAFSGKEATVQIQSITEHYAWNTYDLTFELGKPAQTLKRQLNVLLSQIQRAKDNNGIESVYWYDIPTDTEQTESETQYNTIGFINGPGTFKLFFKNGLGSKTYHVYMKEVGDVTLQTDEGGELLLTGGTYVTIIYVDESGAIYRIA